MSSFVVAVVGEEHHQRLVPQAQALQNGVDRAHEPVHEDDGVGVILLRDGPLPPRAGRQAIEVDRPIRSRARDCEAALAIAPT